MLIEELSENQMAAMTVLRRLEEEVDADRQLDYAADFYLEVDRIARLLHENPELCESIEYKKYLQDSSSCLAFLPNIAILFYPLYRHNYFIGIWDDFTTWSDVCRFRSQVQFFVDMYHGTDFEPFLSQIDLEWLDESLREWALNEILVSCTGEIPKGIPVSHWWWNLGQ